jgi:hypothetical protein
MLHNTTAKYSSPVGLQQKGRQPFNREKPLPQRAQRAQRRPNLINREPREINEQFFKRIFPVSVLADFSHVLRFSRLIVFVFSTVKNLGVLRVLAVKNSSW